MLNALWPICLVIVAALFTYNLTLETGAMELIKKMLASVSVDQRVLLLIIGWGFGNFMEGMAGFGTAVAIPASMLAAIGINPLLSVIACLVAVSYTHLDVYKRQLLVSSPVICQMIQSSASMKRSASL